MANNWLYEQQKITEFVERKQNYLWKFKNYSFEFQPLIATDFVLNTEDKSFKFKLSMGYYRQIIIEFMEVIPQRFENFTIKTSIICSKGEIKCSDTVKFDLKQRQTSTIGTVDPSLIKETDGNFMISCEITYLILITHDSVAPLSATSDIFEQQCLNTFEQDLDAEQYSDFMIIASCNRKLKCHKFILSGRSPVFARLIETDMKEKKENCVKIEDVSYEALKEMLRFMYSAKVYNLDKLYDEIIMAAEKYQIDGLKRLCMIYLAQHINLDTAAKILNLSYCLDLKDLRRKVMQYIKTNASKIITTKEYRSLEKGCLAAEIIHALADK